MRKKIEYADWLEIIVEDMGCGISSEKCKLIFEAFRQENEGLIRNHEGTGLGLTIAKKYTEMMSGKIDLKSEIGKGSSFILDFPISAEEIIFEIKKEVELKRAC
jgi:signal transduction histidine kinase